jgi:hypothetical protein
MIAIDTDDLDAAHAHATVAYHLFEQLHDPWGELEASLLLAQVALARDTGDEAERVAFCERIVLDEAEPRQHRHLTLAWLAQKEQRWADAAAEIDRARAAFGDRVRCGDHTPQLLLRFSRMLWLGPALPKIDGWLQIIEASNPDAPHSSNQWRVKQLEKR